MKSLDDINEDIIAALIHDVYRICGITSDRNLKLDLNKVSSRLHQEGIGFLTKTMPRLGKAFDKALAEDTPLNAAQLGFKTQENSKLPKLFGQLFNRVLKPDGTVLPEPCIKSVAGVRQLTYCYYKYELPYTHEQEQTVVNKFERTEDDLSSVAADLGFTQIRCDALRTTTRRTVCVSSPNRLRNVDQDMGEPERPSPYQRTRDVVTREARILLSRVFASFSVTDIQPRHGPGVVATKQRLWDKYRWDNVSPRITQQYPLDAYFYATLGHVCDCLDGFKTVKQGDLPAQVLLVPKDSRGPRLISCEPVDFQWIQQGLGRAIVDHVERCALTRFNVHFTEQSPNRTAAIYGSRNGRYATLDLNEASDRVSVALVRLLFPSHIVEKLEACRSSSTRLPSGRILKLKKFAPMGSSLCFPILALTIWAILSAAAPDAYTRERILVYGDDVIVPTAFAADAMEQLESFGLKINRDKSCIRGFFRESCGADAFKGVDVTPVRFRTVWSSSRSPNTYTSWIAYANSCYDRGYFTTYERIVGALHHVYGEIPADDMCLTCPSLREVEEDKRPKRTRYNKDLQKIQYRVWDTKAKVVSHFMDGWSMLLRFFAEAPKRTVLEETCKDLTLYNVQWYDPFSVSTYTRRDTSMLVTRWR